MRWWALAFLTACYAPNALDSHCARCSGTVDCLNGDSCIDGLCQQASRQCDGERDGGIDGDSNDALTCFGVDSPPFHRMCIPADQAIPSSFTVASPIATGGTSNSCTYVEQADIPRMKPPLCVIVADDVTIDAPYKVTGARPLVLIARNQLTITSSGLLDLAGRASDPPASATTPAGANVTVCDATGGGVAMGTSGAGGGAGGSFRTGGGDGGATGANVVAAGDPPNASPLLRGGCRGGSGGNNGGSGGGTGGNSGGVIYVLASRMDIDGTINASGGGGRGLAISGAGGGGGGSGGMILLWSAELITIRPNARIFALGGGGASGGPPAISGSPGDDPGGPADPATATPISEGPGSGGGGTVNAAGNPGTKGMTGGEAAGGGGGAGGVGHIKLIPAVPTNPNQVAPPPS